MPRKKLVRYKSDAVILSEKQNTFNRIQRFFNEGDITLTADEENILKRWNHAHSLILQRKFTEQEIIAKVGEIYNVSKYTARNDYFFAIDLFSSAIRVNKKFMLSNHADYIKMKMEKFSQDKSLVHLLPKLMDAYTKTVIAIPDDHAANDMPPPVIIFAPVAGQQMEKPVEVDDALSRIMQRQADSAEDVEIIPEDEPAEE